MLKRTALVGGVAIALIGLGGGYYVHSAAKTHNSIPSPVPAPTNPLSSSGIIDLVNKQREAAGVPDLQTSPELTKSATEKCQDMVANNYYEHANPTTGYQGYQYAQKDLSDNYYIAENLAQLDINDSPTAIQEWMNSPEHKAALLDTKYSLTGVAICRTNDISAFYDIVEHFAGSPVLPSPVAQPSPSGTLCNDGWVSPSTGRGTCSWHHGEAH